MAKEPPKKANILVPLVVVTALGAGGGFVLTGQLTGSASTPEAVAPASTFEQTRMIDVPPVITNLASPAGAFIRLQVSLVVEKNAKPDDANKFATDITAYLRTVPIERLSGPAGLQQLREDLRERADIRLAGQVHDIIMHDLVIQ